MLCKESFKNCFANKNALPWLAVQTLLVATLGWSAVGTATTLVIVAGGYQSCPKTRELVPMPHVAHIDHILESASWMTDALRNQDPDVQVVWSCFSGVLIRQSLGHVVLDGPMEFRFGTVNSGVRAEEDVLSFAVNDVDAGRPLTPYFDFVKRYITAIKPSRIYLTGHSYGGWTALQLGTRLAAAGNSMAGVLLIDPISPFQCRANIMPINIVTQWSATPGCNMAPHDLLPEDMDLLASRSDWRVNFYQTAFWPLHSGPMPYPGWDDRTFSQPATTRWLGTQHSGIVIDLRAWFWAGSRILGTAL